MPQHKIRILQGDGGPVEIRTRPESFDIHERDGALGLCVSWCGEKLIRSPREYLAVTEAWPGRETVELTDEQGYEVVFTGTVRGSGHNAGSFFLSAYEEYGS